MTEPSAHPKPRSSTATAYLLLILAALCWSTNYPLVRLTAPDMPPFHLSFWRWLTAAILLSLIAIPHWKRDLPHLLKRWKYMLVMGGVGIFLSNTGTYWGLHYTTATNGLLLQSATPMITMVSVFALFRETPGLRQCIAILVSMIGVFVIASAGSLANLASLSLNIGDLLIVAGTGFYTIYSALLRIRPPVHQSTLIASCFIIATIFFLPCFLVESAMGQHLDPTAMNMGVTLFLAIVPTIFAMSLWGVGVDRIGATRAGQFFHLIPAFGILQAVLLLGEELHLFHAIGITLIAAGLIIASRKARPQAAAEST